jgi:acyl-CoA thioesterase-1
LREAAPPNTGADFTHVFIAAFPGLATKNGLPLIPFLLESVAGRPELSQPDGIHPTEKGHALVAETVWFVLKSTL